MKPIVKFANLALAAAVVVVLAVPGLCQSAQTRALGTITAVAGNTITLKTDTGAEVTVAVAEGARIVRTQPGQRDLKTASPIEVKDIQVGDRMLATGSPAGGQLQAASVIVMARGDIAQKQQAEQQAWQRGTGGIVTAVDPAASTITVASTPASSMTVHVTPQTVVRRYAPNSVNFNDAKASSLDQVQKGDQLRARGARSADGKEFTAEEVVSGSFRNVAGLVTAVDPAAQTITVNDLLSRKPVTIQLSSDSQLRKLPVEIATRVARLAHASAPGEASASAAPAGQPAPGATGAGGAARPGGMGGGFAGRPGGAPDFQQMLNRTPPITLADLQKGDAVMIVATEGAEGAAPTAITLVSGVEPILTAAPSGGAAAAILSSWNMSAGGGDAGNP